MRKHRKSAPSPHEPRFVKLSSDRRIVLIDQEPLRKEAGRAARKKIAEMEKLESSLEEFDKTIMPAFARWEEQVLGPLLAEERQLCATIARMQSLIDSATFEAMFTDREPEDIFEELEQEMNGWNDKQGAYGREAPPQPQTEMPPDPDAGREFSDDESLFRSYVRHACGEEPDEFSQREYKRLFKDFLNWKNKRDGQTASASRKKEDIPARVKELYRVLVRRLHPDTGNQANSRAQRLWHDLQSAYAAMDVDRLETLLALTDIHESGNALRSTLFHLRKVAKDMQRAVREMKSRLRQAKSSPAWIFWNSNDREATGRIMRQAVEARITHAKKHIKLLESEIAFWKKAQAPTPPPRKSKKRRPSSDSGLDDLFSQGFFDF